MSIPSEERKGWAIVGVHGLYTGWWFTRHQAIIHHCNDLGISWTYARKKGDRAIKVKIIYDTVRR